VSASSDDLPTITILTPCLNPGPYIAGAVESVRRQNYPKVEHIILDAVSRDGSLAALENVAGLRIVSEPDDGSHDAMNKGVRLAGGEIIGFLNADDFYGDGVLPEVAQAFAADPDLDIVAVGTVVFEEGAGTDRHLLAARDHRRADSLWFSELAFGASGFNGRFFRRRVFERFGNFDVKYDFSADRDFLNRLALSDAKRLTLPRYGYFYRSHVGSRTLNAEQRNAEAFADEHRIQALAFARRAPASARPLFLAWHAFSGAKQCYLAARHGRFDTTLIVALKMTMADPLWLCRFPLAMRERREVRVNEEESTAAYDGTTI
jgi:glycosyltransferase involved in cell wall biosynthesis